MNARNRIANRLRPLRRRLAPQDVKETYVNRALGRVEGATYVEIGVRDGESITRAKAARRLGIDPMRTSHMTPPPAGVEFFEQTSDDFFAATAPDVLGSGTVAVALVDGLHEYRQALRDVLNLEPYMAPDGIIVIDDCNPRTAAHEVGSPTGGAWNGDVWKVVLTLRERRPELTCFTLDADQGVGVVSGFGTAAASDVDYRTDHYKALTFEDLSRRRTEVLDLRPPASFDDLLGRGPRQPRA